MPDRPNPAPARTPAPTRVDDVFRIDQEVEIRAPREKAWAALLDVQGWWCHRVTGKGSTLVLEPTVGGRFFERFSGAQGDAEGALWGVVTFLRKPEVLRLEGPLGTNGFARSVYEYRLEARGSGTVLKLSHRCAGEMEPGTRDDYDGGWKALWVHLKALAESGKRFAG